MAGAVAAFLEIGTKRIFASALEWPGWSRGARGEAEALEALVAYGDRYAAVARRAGLDFTAPHEARAFEVFERLPGGSGTDFGVPGAPPAADARALHGSDIQRLRGLLVASWETFDAAAAAAVGRELRTGPRGGGRGLVKMVGHVLEAEEAYLRQLGSRPPRGSDDPDVQMAAVREAALDALLARAEGRPPPNPTQVRSPWSPRYFVRRSAWHVLDHAWEIEDRVM